MLYININVYNNLLSVRGRIVLKRNDLEKELRAHGATFSEGGKHQKVSLNGKTTTIPRRTEIGKLLAKEIKKQLGIL